MSLRYRTWLCSRIHMMNYGAHSLALMPSVWVTELSADFEGHTTATCSQECVSMKDHTCGHIDIRPTKTIIDCPVGLQPCPCTHARTHTRTQIKWVRVWTCSLSLALISCRLAKILHTHQSRRMWERVRERVARERNEEPSEKELGGLCQQQEGGVLSGWLRAYWEFQNEGVDYSLGCRFSNRIFIQWLLDSAHLHHSSCVCRKDFDLIKTNWVTGFTSW